MWSDIDDITTSLLIDIIKLQENNYLRNNITKELIEIVINKTQFASNNNVSSHNSMNLNANATTNTNSNTSGRRFSLERNFNLTNSLNNLSFTNETTNVSYILTLFCVFVCFYVINCLVY